MLSTQNIIFSRQRIDIFFPVETICIKFQILFSRKNKKKIFNLSSAEFTHRVVKDNSSPAKPEYVLLLQTV